MKLYFKLLLLLFILVVLVGGVIPTLVSSTSNEGVFLGFLLLAVIPAGVVYYFRDKKETKE